LVDGCQNAERESSVAIGGASKLWAHQQPMVEKEGNQLQRHLHTEGTLPPKERQRRRPSVQKGRKKELPEKKKKDLS